MAKGSDLDRVTAIVLSEMRPPLVVLVVTYAVGMAGMLFIDGIDGRPMNLFHAFYFMTYTATTTGFGELPQAFTDSQRMWAAACLYMSVISWVYAIGKIITLMQNPHFTLAVAQARFAGAVRRIHGPFFVICGFGDTGSLLVRGLSDRRMNAVIIDADVERIKAAALRDYSVSMPRLEGDASVPKNLQDAGISRPNCRGVVLLTGDEDVNLKIAVMARLLNPAGAVICRSVQRTHDEELMGLGGVVVVDPFETWAHELGLALHQPLLHTLDEWLVGAHGVTLERLISHPHGTWVLCGYGKLGRTLHRSLRAWGVHMVVIDPSADNLAELEHSIVGLATRANLVAAGAADAAGIIAATNSDADNLAILLTARNLNAAAHLIVRQNQHENELAFNAASADLIMQPSLVTARRLLLQLISPLIRDALDHFEANPVLLRDVVLPRLRASVGAIEPSLFTLRIAAADTPSVVTYLAGGAIVELGHLIRNPRNRDESLACVPMLLRRGDERIFMPPDDLVVRVGDEILYCALRGCEAIVRANLAEPYTLDYLITGVHPPRGYVLTWLATWKRSSPVALPGSQSAEDPLGEPRPRPSEEAARR